MTFDGVEYDPTLDFERLNRQIDRIFNLMADGKWRTLQEISIMVRVPQTSVSAHLRSLRKAKFGGHTVNRRRRGDRRRGLFEYQLIPKEAEK